MTWKDSYAIGIPEIDKQHKELCDCVDRLFEAGSQGKGAEEALKVLEFLESYTVRHFADEEKLQQKISYPRYTEHKALHDGFIRQITKLKNDMNATGPTIQLIISINHTISQWLIKHIMAEDKQLKNYIK
jgi:hemerythrin